MAYLFDTDVISATLRPRPDIRVLRRLATAPGSDQFTSAITLRELVFGALRKNRQDLMERIRGLLELIPVVPFDEPAAHIYGELRASLERVGTPLAEADLRIAAIALAKDLTLVSGNERHFSRIPGLRFENWFV